MNLWLWLLLLLQVRYLPMILLRMQIWVSGWLHILKLLNVLVWLWWRSIGLIEGHVVLCLVLPLLILFCWTSVVSIVWNHWSWVDVTIMAIVSWAMIFPRSLNADVVTWCSIAWIVTVTIAWCWVVLIVWHLVGRLRFLVRYHVLSF